MNIPLPSSLFVRLASIKGTRTWIYQPHNIKADDIAGSVVIYLHGFAVAAPTPYEAHIEHLVKQGHYVIFPQYQPGWCDPFSIELLWGVIKIIGKQSPIEWVTLAEEGSRCALESLPFHNRNNLIQNYRVYLFGHSLGGAFAMMWGSLNSGITVTAAVLSSPQPAGFASVPKWIRFLFRGLFGNDINVPNVAGETKFPVAILHAADDKVAPLSDIRPSYEALGSTSKAVYQVQSDTHGYPPLKATHNIALGLPSGTQQDTLNWRYVWSALDQVMQMTPAPQGGNVAVDALEFSMGYWSDGIPIRPVQRIVFNNHDSTMKSSLEEAQAMPTDELFNKQ